MLYMELSRGERILSRLFLIASGEIGKNKYMEVAMKMVLFATLLFLLGYYHGQMEEPIQVASLSVSASFDGTN